jgi:glycerol-3-phosphate acyltransferase PlsX
VGLNKVAVKTHGSADRKQFASAIRLLHEIVQNNIIDQIKIRIQ